jgi:hypothetical protein
METVFDSTIQKGGTKDEKTHTVHTRRLSPYIKTNIDLLKLDIEGAEGLVIEELREAGVLKKIGAIVMEYHYYPTNKDNSLEKILSVFEKEKREHQIYLDEVFPGSSSERSGYYCLIRSMSTEK